MELQTITESLLLSLQWCLEIGNNICEVFSRGLWSGLAWAVQWAVTQMGRWHQWLGPLEIRGTEEDMRTGTETSPEALECRGVWLRTNWILRKEILPLWHLCPGACLGAWRKVWGSVTSCRGRASPCPPLCQLLPSSSSWLALLCGLVRKWITGAFRTSEGRSAPDSGNLNPVEAFSNKQEFLRERFVGISWGVWRRGKDGQTKMAARNLDPISTS